MVVKYIQLAVRCSHFQWHWILNMLKSDFIDCTLKCRFTISDNVIPATASQQPLHVVALYECAIQAAMTARSRSDDRDSTGKGCDVSWRCTFLYLVSASHVRALSIFIMIIFDSLINLVYRTDVGVQKIGKIRYFGCVSTNSSVHNRDQNQQCKMHTILKEEKEVSPST